MNLKAAGGTDESSAVDPKQNPRFDARTQQQCFDIERSYVRSLILWLCHIARLAQSR